MKSAPLQLKAGEIHGHADGIATCDQVKQTVFDFLYGDETGLPESYSEDEITVKSNLVFGHFLTQQQHGFALAAG